LRDEEATSQADTLLDDFLEGKLELLTLMLFDYEIANALRVAVTCQRPSEPDAAAALADFARYTIVRSSIGVVNATAIRGKATLRYWSVAQLPDHGSWDDPRRDRQPSRPQLTCGSEYS
jgi:hypothetical protein